MPILPILHDPSGLQQHQHQHQLLRTDASNFFRTYLSSTLAPNRIMETVSHNVQLPYRGVGAHPTVTAVNNLTSALQRFPAELLVRTAEVLDRAEDLQNLRLINRAFSKAATTVLQSRFVRLYLMPTRPSMARFTSLTMHDLIAPKILQVVVIYMPLIESSITSQCARVGETYDMPEQNVRNIVSEFNDMCSSRDVVTDVISPAKVDVVESGEFERVLGDGIERLPALCSVSLRSTLKMRTHERTSIEPWPSLNLPQFLRYGLTGQNSRFGVIKDLTVAEYARCEILQELFLTSIGCGSPTNILSALERWSASLRGQLCSLSFLISEMNISTEAHWMRGLAGRPSLLEDCMINVTRVVLTMDGRPPLRAGPLNQEYPAFPLEPHWCTLLRAAVNLEVLEMAAVSSTCVGFDTLLGYVFRKCTWPKLTQLSIHRDRNIKLLPTEGLPAHYSLGWYLFLREELDNFLLRHKATLECLDLQNIVGVEQRSLPPPWALQRYGRNFPKCPAPSLPALHNSLDLWVRELGNLEEISVIISLEVDLAMELSPEHPPQILESWLCRSELQALATRLGVEASKSNLSDHQTRWARVQFDLADSKRGTHLRGVTDSRTKWAYPHERVSYM
jgi:hypothetical protein